MLISNEYIEYVKKTMHKDYTVEMAVCALIEEVLEFQESNTTDEFGDLLYQFIVLCLILNIKAESIYYKKDVDYNILDYIISISKQFKKKMTRGMALNYYAIIDDLCSIYSLIFSMGAYYDIRLGDAEKENMKKLNERYGLND